MKVFSDNNAVFDNIVDAKLWHLTCQMLSDVELIPQYDELGDSPPEGICSDKPWIPNGKIQYRYTKRIKRYIAGGFKYSLGLYIGENKLTFERENGKFVLSIIDEFYRINTLTLNKFQLDNLICLLSQ